MVPRSELIKMEDERDAALLDVEGLGYEVAAMRPVVEQARTWRHNPGWVPGLLAEVVDAFEAWEKDR